MSFSSIAMRRRLPGVVPLPLMRLREGHPGRFHSRAWCPTPPAWWPAAIRAPTATLGIASQTGPRASGRQEIAALPQGHEHLWVSRTTPEQVLAVDEALSRLAQEDPQAAEVLKLRYFAGMSVEEAADALGIHRATAHRHWSYARAWIRAEIQSAEG